MIHFNQKVRGGVGDLTKPDVNARPQDNLYLAVNSEWQKDAVIPADRTEIGVNTEIDMRIEKRMMTDLDKFISGKNKIPDIPNLKKAVELYKMAKDFAKRNSDGAKPIQKDLATLTNLKSFSDLQALSESEDGVVFEFPYNFYKGRRDTKCPDIAQV
ncbi:MULTISPECIES: hypothetical protein [Lactobacillus]|uniref:Peptidase M13 N-terminal domain-containing protein n=1 Tax=Lactobacillus xujianguonis TaxID=2495899 RepID=A0A437SXF9_9LACO|nr:hypothetical protein EJK17_01170 [Lactobacillus xujianguonis]RVU77738.1 hypothetical protein EJK20_00540 [Lactobacillus xujianguonis]